MASTVTSATGRMQKNTHSAFTLIELLVVLLIISIILLMVFINAGDFGARRKQQVSAEHFSHLLELASEQAILQHVILGCGSDGNTYRFYILQKPDLHQGSFWQPLENDPLLKPGQLPETMRKQFPLARPQPQMIFTPSGERHAS
jgi:general secretion pathway protein H